MNSGLPDNHASIRFYDGDYPSTLASAIPENCDDVLASQGLAHDLDRYLELAAETDGPVLDLCCGTGRVKIPLARAGHPCTAVDVSSAMLAKMRDNLARESAETRERVICLEQDVTKLNLERRDYRLAICAFNSLLCMPSLEEQRNALRSFGSHLAPGGRLALDLINPLLLKLQGDPVPKPFFTRRDPLSGRQYTRFAACDPLDAQQRQRLHGWYDEVADDGTVRRFPYSLYWRPIFRFELQLLLEQAGLEMLSLEGGHRKEPYAANSPRMFVVVGRSASGERNAHGNPSR
jgi:SAM-dependent methyltransferase